MRRRALIASAALACAAWSACADPETEERRFSAVLAALSTNGDPVAGVQFWADGRALGSTAGSGRLRAELRGREHATVELSSACPPAFRTVTPRRELVLRAVRATGSAEPRPLELTVRCEPLERTAAVIVLLEGPAAAGVPVRIAGALAGQTEADGSAHLLVRAAPHSTLRVELDTSRRPALLPQNPVHTFQVGDRDAVFLVEQRFTVPRRPQARARAAHRPRPAVRPLRIE